MTLLFIRTERLGPEDGGIVHPYSPVTKAPSPLYSGVKPEILMSGEDYWPLIPHPPHTE